MTYRQSVNHYRILLIRAAVLRAEGNRKRAARALGITPVQLRREIRHLAIVDIPPARYYWRQSA